MTKATVTGKRILVTGGTGSFGKMFVKRLLHFSPKEIIVFSRDENKQGAMELELGDKRVRFMLGDVRDRASVRNAVRGVDYIIHAAALKWVPQVELNVWEGVLTNIVGAQNIIDAAREEGVSRVVALSTDKAVEPINAYGMTKALQERLVTTANLYQEKGGTVFISTRYGNVLGSRGSVIPLFRSIIDAGRPLTVTDPSMTRFIMTLEDSVNLVFKALTDGVGGEVFVKKMPAHTVQDLIDVMYENIPKKERAIKIIGTRAGEKIHETLVSEVESLRTVDMGSYYVILPQIPLVAVEKKYAGYKKIKPIVYASNTTERISKDMLRSLLEKEGWLTS